VHDKSDRRQHGGAVCTAVVAGFVRGLEAVALIRTAIVVTGLWRAMGAVMAAGSVLNIDQRHGAGRRYHQDYNGAARGQHPMQRAARSYDGGSNHGSGIRANGTLCKQ